MTTSRKRSVAAVVERATEDATRQRDVPTANGLAGVAAVKIAGAVMATPELAHPHTGAVQIVELRAASAAFRAWSSRPRYTRRTVRTEPATQEFDSGQGRHSASARAAR